MYIHSLYYFMLLCNQLQYSDILVVHCHIGHCCKLLVLLILGDLERKLSCEGHIVFTGLLHDFFFVLLTWTHP